MTKMTKEEALGFEAMLVKKITDSLMAKCLAEGWTLEEFNRGEVVLTSQASANGHDAEIVATIRKRS